MMRLLLLGCTGFVGRELVPQLLQAGHQISLVSRRLPRGYDTERDEGRINFLQLDPAQTSTWLSSPLTDVLADADGVVNLAGEPIAEKRWTESHLKVLEDSRLETTRLLVEALKTCATPPEVLVNASAIGYYGTSRDQRFVESSPAGSDFLASLCSRWESAATEVPSATRLLTLRIGIVVAADGGALGKMLPVFRTGFGGPIGSGQQWMSWIHRSDLCRLIQSGLEDEAWSGVVNAVAPEPVSMARFAQELGRCLGRPSLLPVPGPVLQVLLGDGAKVVLEGQQVASDRLDGLGFSFRFPDLSSAIAASTN